METKQQYEERKQMEIQLARQAQQKSRSASKKKEVVEQNLKVKTNKKTNSVKSILGKHANLYCKVQPEKRNKSAPIKNYYNRTILNSSFQLIKKQNHSLSKVILDGKILSQGSSALKEVQYRVRLNQVRNSVIKEGQRTYKEMVQQQLNKPSPRSSGRKSLEEQVEQRSRSSSPSSHRSDETKNKQKPQSREEMVRAVNARKQRDYKKSQFAKLQHDIPEVSCSLSEDQNRNLENNDDVVQDQSDQEEIQQIEEVKESVGSNDSSSFLPLFFPERHPTLTINDTLEQPKEMCKMNSVARSYQRKFIP